MPAFGLDLALRVLDISESGVRMLAKAEVEPGQEIELRFDSASRPWPLRVTARVVWCIPAADGAYCVGARFEKNITPADLEALASS